VDDAQAVQAHEPRHEVGRSEQLITRSECRFLHTTMERPAQERL